MCPQRLFTNTKLFTIAGKRNPTRARSGPDLAGGAPAEAPRAGRLRPRSSPGERPCAQGAARQGRRVRRGLRPRRLCLRGAEELWPLPCSGLKDPEPSACPWRRPALSSAASSPAYPNPRSAFPVPAGSGKTPRAKAIPIGS